MMRLLNNKKNVKVVSIIVAFLFVLGVGALAYTQMANPAMASDVSNIGVVDMKNVLTPDSDLVKKAQSDLEAYSQDLSKEFQEKSASLDDQGKAKLDAELRQKMTQKQQETQDAINKQISDAAKSVGDAKGLSVVLSKDTVLYGGVDITDQVAKKLGATDAANTSDANASK